jgi:hypothetical protein
VQRVISLTIAVLLLGCWVLPSHGDTATQMGATIDCADFCETDMPALAVQDGLNLLAPWVVSYSMAYLSLTPQLLSAAIFRPPQA